MSEHRARCPTLRECRHSGRLVEMPLGRPANDDRHRLVHAVQPWLAKDESVVFCEGSVKSRRLSFSGGVVVTSRRILLVARNGTVQNLDPSGLGVKDPDDDGIDIRLHNGRTAHLKCSLALGDAITVLVLGPARCAGGLRSDRAAVGEGVYLGGYGCALEPGGRYAVVFDRRLDFVARTQSGGEAARISSTDLIEIDVSGPGAYRKGATWFGGGFGVEGAVKGAIEAAVLSSLTSRRRVLTVVRVASRHAVAVFATDQATPDELRLALSEPLLAATRNREQGPAPSVAGAGTNLADQLATVADLHNLGALSDTEFESAKRRILGGG